MSSASLLNKRTKHSRRFCALLFAVAIAMAGAWLLASGSGAVEKAYGEDYTYTVRVWAGNEGTVNGQSLYAEKTGVKYGEVVALGSDFSVAVTNSKYYHKGFRIGGQDNQKEDGSNNLVNAVRVTEDMDFVVSYGVKGNQVGYTVNYVEYQTGQQLAPSESFSGNVGDKPVVAFEYIEGYRPLFRNITRTLTGNAADNVMTFEYVPLATGENADGTTTTTTTVTYVNGTTTGTTGGATGTTGAAGTAGTTGTTGTTSASSATTETSPSASAASASATPPATQEIRDEDQTALTSGIDDSSGNRSDNGPMSKDDASFLPILARIGIGILAVIVISLVAFMIAKRRCENDLSNRL